MSMCETMKDPTGLLLARLIQPQPLPATWPLQGVTEAVHQPLVACTHMGTPAPRSVRALSQQDADTLVAALSELTDTDPT